MPYKVGYLMKATAGIYDLVRQAFPADFELVTPSPSAESTELVRDLDFLIAGKVTSAMIDAAPHLRFVMTPGVGYEGVDLAALRRRGIPLATTIPGNIEEVAEHTLLLMLAASRRLTELDAALRRGEWLMWDRRLDCHNLAGKSLGLVGMGRIGREVARRAEAFRMLVHYSDPAVSGVAWGRMELDDLLAASDYISLHVPLSPATRLLIDAGKIARMKPGAILINTSRGEVVDEAALVRALETGHLAAAGLDVFAQEPPAASNPLFALPQVVVTPHVGAGTIDGMRIKAARYVENIRRFLDGQEPFDVV